MVQLMNSAKAPPESLSHRRKMVPVKLEAKDSSEEHHGPLNKRSKLSSPPPIRVFIGHVCFRGKWKWKMQQECNLELGGFPIPPSQYNPLDEPSPLGLRLKKSPSLLDLIQMTLSQGNSPKVGTQAKKEHNASSVSGANDKLKASNFPASLLKIGTWEYKSRHEGDLVAKCYFAKHKLVWEVLDGGLKNKIEIQWSDIMALEAKYPDDAPGTLDVVLARQPLFFRETNPQPRKHTLWQATSDFTGGQASIHRQHFLQCPQGLLGKHFEKLIQCDPRLNFLSQQGEIVLESPYFEPRISMFDDSNELNREFDLNGEERQAFFDLRDTASPSRAQPSPSSVMDTHAIEEIRSRAEELKRLIEKDQIKVPELRSSMSMSDLVSHIEHRFSEQRTSNNFTLSVEERQSLEILDEITRCLFSDSQLTLASDEKCIMSRVNSLCCLLQKDSMTSQNLQVKGDDSSDVIMDKKIREPNKLSASDGESKVLEDLTTPESEPKVSAMTRKDSVGELLLNLPRIASLPQFLFNISEDFNSQAR
ncbi:unnamed protein product [Camellia sinensis]